MDEADLLLDRPPGGWDDLVTKEWLHLELTAFRAEIDARFAAVDGQLAGIGPRLTSLEQGVAKLDSRLDTIDREMRAQTWRLVAVLMTGMSIAIAAASAITIIR